MLNNISLLFLLIVHYFCALSEVFCVVNQWIPEWMNTWIVWSKKPTSSMPTCQFWCTVAACTRNERHSFQKQWFTGELLKSIIYNRHRTVAVTGAVCTVPLRHHGQCIELFICYISNATRVQSHWNFCKCKLQCIFKNISADNAAFAIA